MSRDSGLMRFLKLKLFSNFLNGLLYVFLLFLFLNFANNRERKRERERERHGINRLEGSKRIRKLLRPVLTQLADYCYFPSILHGSVNFVSINLIKRFHYYESYWVNGVSIVISPLYKPTNV